MGPTYVLPFKIQPQQGQNWCWAANAASISYFYEGLHGMTQCQIANGTFYRNDCCQSPNPCDNEGNLQNALGQITHNLAAPPVGPISTRDISDQINNSRVIG